MLVVTAFPFTPMHPTRSTRLVRARLACLAAFLPLAPLFTFAGSSTDWPLAGDFALHELSLIGALSASPSLSVPRPGLSRKALDWGPGVSLIPDMTAPGGLSLIFDGTHDTMRNRDPAPIDVGPQAEITIRFKPSVSDAPLGKTLVRVADAYEIRLWPKVQRLDFIVFPESKDLKPRQISLPYTLEDWNAATATVAGNTITLEVNGQASTAELLPAELPSPKNRILHVGGFSNRPYVGAIAYLGVAAPSVSR